MLSLEIGDYSLSGVPPSADIIRSLLALGYSAWQYRGGTFIQHRIAERYGLDNLIFVPNRASPRNATAWPGAYASA